MINIERIRERALAGEENIFFMMDGKEALVIATKYSKEWWMKATEADMRRVAVR